MALTIVISHVCYYGRDNSTDPSLKRLTALSSEPERVACVAKPDRRQWPCSLSRGYA
jgi:hypothetical protein